MASVTNNQGKSLPLEMEGKISDGALAIPIS